MRRHLLVTGSDRIDQRSLQPLSVYKDARHLCQGGVVARINRNGNPIVGASTIGTSLLSCRAHLIPPPSVLKQIHRHEMQKKKRISDGQPTVVCGQQSQKGDENNQDGQKRFGLHVARSGLLTGCIRRCDFIPQPDQVAKGFSVRPQCTAGQWWRAIAIVKINPPRFLIK